MNRLAKPFRHALGRPRITRDKAHPKGIAALDLDLDILRPHPFDDVFHDERPTFGRIQIELANDRLQAGAAQNDLPDASKPVFNARRDRRLDVVLWNALRNDLDQGLGAILHGHAPRDHERAHGGNHKRHDQQPFAMPQDVQNVFRRVGFSRQHVFYFLSSGTHKVNPTRTECRSMTDGTVSGTTMASPRSCL